MKVPMRWFCLAGLPCLMLAAFSSTAFPATTVLIEAEGFADRGGWKLDHQAMDVMGSPYLLAHGLGRPVDDAKTIVAVPETAEYRVLVRTKDWVAPWGAPGAPGKFQVLIDGKPLDETFGTRGADWFWHDGGTVRLEKGEVTLALKDLTGFEGRCDAILLTTDKQLVPPNKFDEMTDWRRKLLNLDDKLQDGGRYDLVVVGGGMAGSCTAVAAARLGLDVALIQNRHVLGGNSSSEIRVWINGRFKLHPYPVIGEIVAQMYTRPSSSPGKAEEFGDDLKMEVVLAEKKLALRLGEHVNGVETDGEGRITAVVSQNTATGERTRYRGRWFADCTGDGCVGYLAGADFESTEKGHMGASNMWYPVDTGEPSAFPRCPWALDVSGKPIPTRLRELGVWFWESGFDKDTVEDVELIRDHNLRAMYGVWDNLKNERGLYPNHEIQWAAYVSGKRESRRLLGDVILTKDDIMSLREFPDAAVTTTWSIDLHYPYEKYVEASPKNPFISKAVFTRFKRPYAFPYRCLYSRNVPNLFMAGRDISVTHEALGTVRVMATGGMMGEVVGRAAAVCKQYDADPRDVYTNYLDDLKKLLRTPTRRVELKPPASFADLGENTAPTAVVNAPASRDVRSLPPSLINDGSADLNDNTARWLSTAGVPHQVELSWAEQQTLVAARLISGYQVDGAAQDAVASFVFEYHDGEQFKPIPETRTTGNTKTDWHRIFQPVRSDRVRVVIEETPGGISRIWEIELYAPGKDGS